LQAFMTKGVLDAHDLFGDRNRNPQDEPSLFIKILQEYSEYDFDPRNRKELNKYVSSVVTKINQEIRPLGMEIRRGMDERNGKFAFILINRISSEQTVSAFSDYSPLELEYFKAILAAIFEEESRTLSERCCLNLTTRLSKKMTMEEGERFLERMIADNWLEKKRGQILLHVRTIHEMEPYLKDTFQLDECQLCKIVVISKKNQECASCGAQAHWCCISKLPRRVCPKEDCRSPWPMPDKEGGSQQSSNDSTVSQNVSTSTVRKRIQPMVDSDAEGD